MRCGRTAPFRACRAIASILVEAALRFNHHVAVRSRNSLGTVAVTRLREALSVVTG
jgi:hypothetical protein